MAKKSAVKNLCETCVVSRESSDQGTLQGQWKCRTTQVARRTILIALFISVFFLTPAIAPEEKNLVRNPGFEEGLSDAGIPLGWNYPGSMERKTVSLDEAEKWAGSASLKVDIRPGPYSMEFGQRIKVKPEMLYEVSGWLRQEIRGGAHIQIKGGPGFSERITTKSSGDTGKWVYRSQVFATGSDWKEVLLLCRGSGSYHHTAWFDDISLKELGPDTRIKIDVGKEPAFTPRPAYAPNKTTETRNLLKNSSFEEFIPARARRGGPGEVPEHWTRWGEYLRVSRPPQWRIRTNGAYHGKAALWTNSKEEYILPGETPRLNVDDYTASVYLKSSAPGALAQIKLFVLPDVDDGQSDLQLFTKRVSLSTSWKRYSVTGHINRYMEMQFGAIPDGIFYLGLRLLKGKDLWADAAQIEEGKEPTPYQESAREIRSKEPAPKNLSLASKILKSLQATPARPPQGARRNRLPLSISGDLSEPMLFPVESCIPLSQGQLFSKENVRLLARDDREIPLQTEVIARWAKDKSIKSLSLVFYPSRDAGREYVLEYGQEVSARDFPTPLRVVEGDRFQIDTGKLRFYLNRKAFKLLEDIYFDANGDGHFSEEERLDSGLSKGSVFATGPEGTLYEAANDEASLILETSGPLRAVIRASGWLRSKDGERFFHYVTRIFAYANSPALRIQHTFVNLDELPSTAVGDLGLSIGFNAGQGKYILGSDAPRPFAGEIAPGTEAHLIQVARNLRPEFFACEEDRCFGHGWKAPGWAALEGKSAGLLLSIRDFWQNHPKELLASQDGLTFYFWPRDNVKALDLTRGVARTHELSLYFHSPSSPKEVANLAEKIQTPVKVIPPRDWLAKTGAFGRHLTESRAYYPVYNKITNEYFANFLMGGEVEGLWGMFNYGDYRSPFWRNSESYLGHSLFMQYVRTGDEKILQRARRATSHTSDVDINHTTGGMYVHSVRHTMAGPSASHNWLQGMADCYLLSGDRRILEAILENADWLYGRAKRGLSGRSMGWAMWCLTEVYDITGEEKYRYGALLLVKQVAQRQFVNLRVPGSGGGFLYGGTNLNGLMRLYEATGDERLKQLFLNEIDIISQAVRKSEKKVSIYGRDSMMFAPLGFAYGLTGDTGYLKIGMEGLYNGILFGNRHDPTFNTSLGSHLLYWAKRAGKEEPYALAPTILGFKRTYNLYLLDEDDEAFKIVAYKGAKAGSKITIYAPDGKKVLQKEFETDDLEVWQTEIPSDGKKGTYRLEVNQAYPMEVNIATTLPKMVLYLDRTLRKSARDAQEFFFWVPEGLESFKIGLRVYYGGGQSGVQIVGPDGEILQEAYWLNPRPNVEDKWHWLETRVPATKRGKIWSLRAKSSGQFEYDFQGIKPFFSLKKESFFLPEVK